jgi:hypothetical protein
MPVPSISARHCGATRLRAAATQRDGAAGGSRSAAALSALRLSSTSTAAAEAGGTSLLATPHPVARRASAPRLG